MRAVVLALLLLVGAVVFWAALGLAPTGDPTSPPARHVSPRYIEKSYEETGSPNMVTAILADYRGYDTLGETVVIFTAGVATLLILKGRERE